VQVVPIKPTLKAHGTKRLNLKYDEVLSSFAFKFNLRRYNPVANQRSLETLLALVEKARVKGGKRGATQAVVGRCRLTLSNPR
jgi:hypothetical protein